MIAVPFYSLLTHMHTSFLLQRPAIWTVRPTSRSSRQCRRPTRSSVIRRGWTSRSSLPVCGHRVATDLLGLLLRWHIALW